MNSARPEPEIMALSEPACAAELWDAIVGDVRAVVDPQTFRTWFLPARGVRLEGRTLVVGLPNPTFRRYFLGAGAELIAQPLGARGLRAWFECGEESETVNPEEPAGEKPGSRFFRWAHGVLKLDAGAEEKILLLSVLISAEKGADDWVVSTAHRLGRHCGLSGRAVRRWSRKLKQRGLLAVERLGWEAIYRVQTERLPVAYPPRTERPPAASRREQSGHRRSNRAATGGLQTPYSKGNSISGGASAKRRGQVGKGQTALGGKKHEDKRRLSKQAAERQAVRQ